MAADRREPRQRRIDPIVAGIGDGVAAGYRAVESVLVGVSESARMRSGARASGSAPASARAAARPSARPAGSRTQTRTTATTRHAARDRLPTTLMGEVADVTAEILDTLGEAVREIAGHLAERDRFAGVAQHHTLELEGAPGDTATDEFLLSNTGPTALRDLAFEKTNLIGAAATPIRASAVSFTAGSEGTVDRVRPGGSTTITVAVKIPARAPAGVYRGVVCARFASSDDRTEATAGPVGAWALLELEVLATDPFVT